MTPDLSLRPQSQRMSKAVYDELKTLLAVKDVIIEKLQRQVALAQGQSDSMDRTLAVSCAALTVTECPHSKRGRHISRRKTF